MTGIDVSGQVIVLDELQAELVAGGVPVPHGLTIAGPPLASPVFPPPPPGPPPPCAAGSLLFTYDAQGNPADLPAAADAIVEAYTPSGTSRSGASVAHQHIAAATTLDELKVALLEAVP